MVDRDSALPMVPQSTTPDDELVRVWIYNFGLRRMTYLAFKVLRNMYAEYDRMDRVPRIYND